jgi:hypothetical protein
MRGDVVKRAITVCAVLSSLTALVVIVGGALMLARLEHSDAGGASLAIGALAAGAFALTLVLVFAPVGTFRRSGRRPAGIVATFFAALPVGVLGTAAILFVGLPGSAAMPELVWPLRAAGIVLALGAVSVVALGYLRVTERNVEPG